MKTAEELKEMVKEKYAEIALQSKESNETSCCGATGCGPTDYTIFSEDYTKLEGYAADADLGLGCGLPTEFAQIKKGDTVIDLGSGAGNDCFIARAITGETGKVIGIDMTEAMIQKAKENTTKLGYKNVEFRLGEIEDLPVAANRADVIVSNCVLNLVPDKIKAFKEVYRVLKPGGHISVSDVVLKGNLPEAVQQASEMYAGCVSGALQQDDYMAIIEQTGFKNIKIQKSKDIQVPDNILMNYLSDEEIEAYKNSGTGIYSITVYAEKPDDVTCCAPASGCC
ncbi:MAG: arsenite methyltransferase [Bacteroidia bacterium]